MIQPLLVQEQDDEFRVIAGHKRLAAAREAGLRDVPCVVYEIADEKAARLGEASNVSGRPAVDAIAVAAQPEPQTADRSLHAGAELTQSLTTIAACADLLSAAPSDLTRGVVGNLIRAESWRASTLLVATRILRGELTVARTPVDVNTLLARVAQGFAAERAVRHSAVEVRSALAPHTCIACDDQVLSGALAAAVMATLSLFEGTREATIALTATAEAGQPTVITVSQRCASAHAAWSARAFDRTWSDRPGGATALLLMLSMQQAAETLGATLSVDSGAAGTSIALTFPASW